VLKGVESEPLEKPTIKLSTTRLGFHSISDKIFATP
jgi:hypothetical protein